MTEVTRYWTIGGERALHPYHLLGDEDEAVPEDTPWYRLANGVCCPRGEQWGEAHFLVSDETLQAIDLDSPIDIKCVHEDGETDFTGYYVIRTQAAKAIHETVPHWITLADRRWVFAQVAANKRYNFRKDKGTGASKYVADTLNAGSLWTWQEILDDLWGLLPAIAFAVPSIPAAAASTPENLDFYGMSAWKAINLILTALGCAIAYDPIAELFEVVELKESQGLSATAYRDRLIYDFRPDVLSTSVRPDKVAVTFQQVPGLDNTSAPFMAEPSVEEATVSGGGITGTTYPISDTMFAWDDNSTDRTARAEEIADAIKGLFKGLTNGYGKVYSGILPIATGEDVSHVTWINDGIRGTVTEVRNQWMPFEWPKLPEVLGSGGGAAIEFTVDSLRTAATGDDLPYYGLKIATVTVTGAPCNRSDLIGTTVDVVDHSGCVFDHPIDDLQDVWGWATEKVFESLEPGATAGTLTPCHWSADDRCCVAADVG